MTSRDFCYWLQGYFEIVAENKNNSQSLTVEQIESVKKHLAMVFIHEIDPSMGPKPHQDKLTAAHAGLLRPDEPIARC